MNIFHRLTQDKFCRHLLAVDKDGNEVGSCSHEAIKWCVIGWLRLHKDKRNMSKIQSADIHLQMMQKTYAAFKCGIAEANDKMGYDYVKFLQDSIQQEELEDLKV
ncbi:MAG: hypothetical protein ACREBU_00825 [Nitrososphaera sp.]